MPLRRPTLEIPGVKGAPLVSNCVMCGMVCASTLILRLPHVLTFRIPVLRKWGRLNLRAIRPSVTSFISEFSTRTDTRRLRAPGNFDSFGAAAPHRRRPPAILLFTGSYLVARSLFLLSGALAPAIFIRRRFRCLCIPFADVSFRFFYFAFGLSVSLGCRCWFLCFFSGLSPIFGLR